MGGLKYIIIVVSALWLLYGTRIHVGYFETLFGCFLQKGFMGIFWFFGSLFILYGLSPMLNKMLIYSENFFLIILILLCAIGNSIFLMNVFDIHIETMIPQTFRLWNWLFYFCLGGYIKKKGPHDIPNYLLLVFAFGSVCFQSFFNKFIGSDYCEFYYSSFLIQFFVFLIFEKISSKKFANQKVLKFIDELSYTFLPTYSFHLFAILVVSAFIKHLNILMIGEFVPLLYWILSSVISISTSYMLMKLPLADKIFRI